ncbi:MAG: hypothetical protein WDO14_06890 [Bacteroidota bacterium]
MLLTINLFYFPAGLRYATPVFFLFGLYILYVGYWIATIAIIVISIFILTAQNVTVIDLKRKQFSEAFAFFWIPLVKERKQFSQLHKIVITKESYAQTVNTRAQSRTVRWSDYTATLLYDDNKELALITRDDKADVIQFALLYSKSLNVAMEDFGTTTSSSRPSYR